eukprot:TRINITY_DN28514_c0_g2_i1.p1 TRINITY_DN28514_c0_g2~~TRINITY_DN28514_c0_g2_i1.p1  ORF type:complete len:561 (+),score=87.53 TRINITY_DN28514_c0_g2_i1:48-1730(+)
MLWSLFAVGRSKLLRSRSDMLALRPRRLHLLSLVCLGTSAAAWELPCSPPPASSGSSSASALPQEASSFLRSRATTADGGSAPVVRRLKGCRHPSADGERESVELTTFAETARTTWDTCFALLASFVVGVVLSLSPASAAAPTPSGTEEETVEAAWGFVSRNYYDQTFNNQNWTELHDKYLERARSGESSASLTRQMISSLGDKYSRVVDADAFEKMMAYDPLGVGLVLTRDANRNVVVSNPPFKGSSAAAAGLKEGDIVDAVDGNDLLKQSLFAVMEKVAQADKPEAVLSVRRAARSQAAADEAGQKSWDQTLKRVRATPPQNEVISGAVPAAGPESDGHRIGYIRLKNFGSRSPIDTAAALERLASEGADEFVLDVRGNPGGSFQAALEVAELFLKPGSTANLVKTPKSVEDQPLVLTAAPNLAEPYKQPLALLVDEGSASASEVLASALRGNCRATLLGGTTFGKAAVQGVFGLPNGEAVALTVAKYKGPYGTRIEGGLKPDGDGPQDLLSRFASAAGIPSALKPEDYARVNFSENGPSALLRSCQEQLAAASSSSP